MEIGASAASLGNGGPEELGDPRFAQLQDRLHAHPGIDLGCDRGRSLGDRAALALEADLDDALLLKANCDIQLIATGRALYVSRMVGLLQTPAVARVTEVTDDQILVERIFHAASRAQRPLKDPKRLRASS